MLESKRQHSALKVVARCRTPARSYHNNLNYFDGIVRRLDIAVIEFVTVPFMMQGSKLFVEYAIPGPNHLCPTLTNAHARVDQSPNGRRARPNTMSPKNSLNFFS